MKRKLFIIGLKNNRKRKIQYNEQKGVTLVALVVTIIVLLVLAGVTISLVTGNDGIMQKAKQASEETKKAEERTSIELAVVEAVSRKQNVNITFGDIVEELTRKNITNSGQVNNETYAIVTNNGYLVEMEKNGSNWKVSSINKIEDSVIINSLYPEIGIVSPKRTIKITAIDIKNGIKKIILPNGQENTYGANSKNVSLDYDVYENGTYTFKIETNSGEVKDYNVEVSNIEGEEIAIVPSAGVSEWTTSDAEVEVLWPNDIEIDTKQISLDGGQNYITYTNKVQISNNCTVKARALKSDRVIKEAQEVVIDKIDKNAPNVNITFENYTIANAVLGVNASITCSDNVSGMNYTNTKYALTESQEKLGNDPSNYNGEITGESTTYTKTKKAGTYYMHVLVADIAGNIQEVVSNNSVVVAGVKDFAYTGSAQSIQLPEGEYKLEVWGAQGGYRSTASYGGKGGYSVGTLELTQNTTLYAYVGGSGRTGGTQGGFNGGGSRGTYYGGGGASDFRIGTDDLKARVIVAGGGGSDGATSRPGGYGGGISGETKTESYGSGGQGGTQTSAGAGSNGTAGSFGQGGYGQNANSGYGGAGGGGWYGGAGTYPDGSADDDRGGGGGSGYVYTAETASNYPSGCLLSQMYQLKNASTTAGSSSFDSTTVGTKETGHEGDGYARITCLD